MLRGLSFCALISCVASCDDRRAAGEREMHLTLLRLSFCGSFDDVDDENLHTSREAIATIHEIP